MDCSYYWYMYVMSKSTILLHYVCLYIVIKLQYYTASTITAMGYNLSVTALSLCFSQCSNLLASIVHITMVHSRMQLSEVATVLGQMPDCLLGDCDKGYIYLPQLSAVRCQYQHTFLCHFTGAEYCDLLQVRAAACQVH